MSRKSSTTWLLCGVALGAGWLLRERLRREREDDLSGQIALITGGSRGLGLLLAKEFAAQGCRIAICARDADELARAAQMLRGEGAEVFPFSCDLTSQQQAEEMVQAVLRHYGGIDILVNNAGVITVGPAQRMEVSDFQHNMDVNFYGALYTTWAVLEHMRSRRTGRIVNITSIGGRISVPHLLPYSCSKFAATAFSEGLRAELRRDNIQVTTILPTTMRTGSHIQVDVRGQQEAEFTGFSLSATLPLLSLSAKNVAQQVVTATKRGEAERVVGLQAQAISMLHGLFPAAVTDLFGCINTYILPEPGGSPSIAKGLQIQKRIESPVFRILTSLGRRASRRLNQLPDAFHHST